MSKLTRIMVIALALTLVPIVSLSDSHVSAAPGDETMVGTITLYPTIECIGVISDFTSDNNQNNSTILEYRQIGTGSWKIAHEMYADRSNNQFRGSIFWLTPDTQYEVRVTYIDPDGVTNGPAVGTVTTRDDSPPIGTNYLVVAQNGSDETGTGTEANPYRTIQYTANVATPGDTILIRGGTWNERIDISSSNSGAANAYITFIPYLGEHVILDGNGLDYIFVIDGADYIRIKGLELQDTNYSAIVVTHDANGTIVEDCVINDPNHSSGGTQGGVRLLYGAQNSLIQNNVFNINYGTERLTFGVAYWQPGWGHVIRNNVITSVTGALRDGVGGGPEDDEGYTENWDVYNNIITGALDDAISMEGGDVNVRIWGNTIADCLVGIALCPVLEGPAYVFRNVISDIGDNTGWLYKLGDNSYGRIYSYHNTLYGTANGYGQTNSVLHNIVSRNNIIYTARYVIEIWGGVHDLDYDYLYSTDSVLFIKWASGVRYYDLEDFSSNTGQEIHGISVADTQFTNVASRDFTLQPTSPCIDAGEILVGFNDENSPWPYSGNGPDIGAYEYAGGGPTNYPPVLGSIGNKSVNADDLLQFTVSATDVNGDTLTYSATNLPPGASFIPSTRTFSWTPTSSQVGTYPNIRFTVSDGSLTDYENITITVLSGDNSAPVLNAIGNKSVGVGQTLQFTISATDADGDTLTYSATGLPTGATFTPATRTFSWTPTSSQVGTYPNIRFTVSDGFLTDYEDITITVTIPSSLPLRVNAGGELYTDSEWNTWQADQAYTSGSWGFYGTDHDTDRGTSHSISGTVDDRIYQTERWGLSGYRFDLGNGTYNVILHFAETYRTGPGQRVFDVSIEGQLVLNDFDIYSEVGYSTALEKVFNNIFVQDGQLNIDFTTYIEQPEINGIEIFSTGANNAPVLSYIGNKSVNAGQTLQFTVSATDPNGDTLTYSATNLPPGASFIPSTRTFSWTPTSSQVGTYYNVRFTVSDGSLTDYEYITITVLSADNSAPVLNAIGNKSVSMGQTLQFIVSATDVDGDTLTYSASNLPPGASFNSQTRIFSWIPGASQAGSYPGVLFTVSDDELTDYEYITITVVESYEDWDVNSDGVTNILDVILVGQHWGETGFAGWIRADVNKDGIINVLDMITIGQHWTG
ncbi:MAG TPA: hypothetical protein G4O18_03535 [Dehalococcoidia bacterium]|nr:hypothetical protein [Dehalococcoidia bacterium]